MKNKIRLYHVIVINEFTGVKTYMTVAPVTHKEARTIKSKINPFYKFRKIQLEESK